MTPPLARPAAPLGAALLALACAPADGPPPEGAASEAAPAAAEPGIALPPTVRRNLGITFAPVEVRRVARALRVPGAFELRPDARREYRMVLPGEVELLVAQYEEVEPGRALYRFRSPAWPELLHEVVAGEQEIDAARADIAVAEARLEEARRLHALARERLDTLAGAEVRRADLEAEAAALEASLGRLEAERDRAEARLASARRTRAHALHRASEAAGVPEEELEREVRVGERVVPAYETLSWIEVRAAAAGVVEELAVPDGAFVQPPAPVLSTVDPTRLRFRATALQADLSTLLAADEARIVPPEGGGLPAGEAVEATVALGPVADPDARTLPVVADPAELRPWTRPGVAAFLEVVRASSGGPALAVPRRAVVRDGLEHVVFRRDPSDPDRALRVEADLGADDGRWVELRSGVGPGDEVVLDGAYELVLATQRGGAAPVGGHVHADGTVHTEQH